MQRPPLPVDPVDGFWDILGAIGDFIGGLGAAFALVVASLAYRNQVNDASRQQASKVNVRIREGKESDPGSTRLELYNGSDQPIYSIAWIIDVKRAEDKQYRTEYAREYTAYLGAFEAMTLVGHGLNHDTRLSGTVAFKDAMGKKWVRMLSGSLHRAGVPRKYGGSVRVFGLPK